MREVLGQYMNGNISTTIYDDGTKIRVTKDDYFKPAFAENCDVTITKKCDGGCTYCYMGCSPEGVHGNILNQPF